MALFDWLSQCLSAQVTNLKSFQKHHKYLAESFITATNWKQIEDSGSPAARITFMFVASQWLEMWQAEDHCPGMLVSQYTGEIIVAYFIILTGF